MRKDYAKAYSEVLEVLKYIPKEDYDKIPSKMLQLMQAKCDENSKFTYNVALPFEKQNLSKDAKLILAMIFRNCWITQEQKVELAIKEKEFLAEKEKEKREKYSMDKIFNSEKQEESSYIKEVQEDNSLDVQKEKWYIKIFNKIINIFK